MSGTIQHNLDIHLHLGAHKTATTHIQSILRANRERLLSSSIKLSLPWDVRKEWLPLFCRYCNRHRQWNSTRLINQLVDIAPTRGLWVLSDENIIGVSKDFIKKPGIYSMAQDRTACLKSLFPSARIKLFFSIRSYDSFYRSAYCEVARQNGFFPFEDFFNPKRFANNSWLELVGRFQDVLPPEDIILWRFEDFQQLLPQVLQLLTGIDDVGNLIRNYKPKVTQSSFSAKTMERMGALQPMAEREESKKILESLNRAFPLSEKFPPYRPFSVQQEAEFQDQYAEDVRKIRSNYPQIHFLSPQRQESETIE